MDELSDHLEAIATRRHDARVLKAAPGPDRTEPVAREWVRRWGPAPLGTALPDCSCAAGHCAVCN
jgi:hypothetical protein